MSFIEQIKSSLAVLASESLGVEVDSELIELANPKAGSHLALPCFRFASQLSKSPNEIAQLLADSIKSDQLHKVESNGPYVNFWIKPEFLSSWLGDNSQRILNDREPNGKTAIIEFLSVNLAKPVSIGHLRNLLQGRALCNAYRVAGYKVITDNHVGDWGTVFGMWVVGFEKFSSERQLSEGGVNELGRVYVELRKELKAEEARGESELAESVQDWLKRLEAQDEQAVSYHKMFSEISLHNLAEQTKELGVVFDYNLGESFYIPRGKQMVNEMLESGDAIRNDDGSVIVPLDEQGIDTPMLVEKSNGAALYHTSDIATIEYREKTWNPDCVIYVVAAEQQFHFKQLFAANKKMGWSDAELVHHWYGLIEELDQDGNRAKMSSRKTAIYMSDLLDLAINRSKEIAAENMNDDDIKRIAYGALTFQEFSASHRMNTLFDWNSMFSLSGFSGPYVQYAVVRINSILDKSEESVFDLPEDYDWLEYADLLWQICLFESVFSEALEEREFSKLATYSYDLARMFNKFYEDNQVLNAETDDRRARLWLIQTIGKHIERSLGLLGIDIPSKM